jgi:hypothetical protein
MAQDQRTPVEEVRRLYEEAETRSARAMEQLVSRDSFGELLARLTENATALTRIGYDTMDLIVRNLRIAGRRDIVALGRQLARTEDKLEMLWQEVERLREEGVGQARPRSTRRANASGNSGSRSRSGRGSSAGSRSGSGSRRPRTK